MRSTIAALLLTLAPIAAGAQTEDPDAPASERLRELIGLVQDFDPERVAAYVDEHFEPGFRDAFPMEAHVNFLATVWDQTRPVAVHRIESDTAHRATALLEAGRLEAWRTLTVEVEPEPPHRIASVGPFRPAPAPDGREPGAPLPGELHAYARRIADAELFSGGVLAAEGKDVVLREAYGEASRELGVPNSPETRFILGSINKMFTAVAILQLAEAGALSLHDTVATHLPGVLPDTVARRITLRQLLTHTSGLGDFLFTPEMEGRDRSRYRTIEDYVPLLADDTLAFEPGTDWSYSNTGFLVLGAIIEAVSGESYYDYVRTRVLDPAGMTDTGWPELDRVPRGVASTYERTFRQGEPGFVSDRYSQVVKGTPAGGGFSTLDDMHRFALALLDGRLLPDGLVDRMLSPKPELGSPHYGYGAQIFDDGWVGHTGGGPGTSDYFMIHPETRAVVVVLGNQRGASREVAVRAQRMLER